MNIVNVKLNNNSGSYAFYYEDLDLKIGDTVVCDTMHGYIVGEVISFNPVGFKPTKMVVDKVNVEAHFARIAKERARQERTRQVASIKSQIDTKIKNVIDVKLYEKYAEVDPTIKELLDKLNSLIKEE